MLITAWGMISVDSMFAYKIKYIRRNLIFANYYSLLDRTFLCKPHKAVEKRFIESTNKASYHYHQVCLPFYEFPYLNHKNKHAPPEHK